jgi:hypothetical protein
MIRSSDSRPPPTDLPLHREAVVEQAAFSIDAAAEIILKIHRNGRLRISEVQKFINWSIWNMRPNVVDHCISPTS